jgi:Kef-type K+ transport system membrane component KefB
LIAAKLGGDLAVRVGQPAVLGELIAGVVLGNLVLLDIHLFETLRTDPFVDMFARLGVLLLLFEVGLESTVGQMAKVGASALVVAVVGVVVPFGLCWGVSALLLPDQSVYAHAFIGATLCATSVGITARVLKDLGASQTNEARIILGAAVIDDVLGLVVLAVVTGVIAAANTGGSVSPLDIGIILGKAFAFLVGALVIGVVFSKRLFALASMLRTRGVLLAVSLCICFVFAWAADAIGLAAIVGAFAAGLVLEDVHFKDFTSKGVHELEDLIAPITAFLVPVFFVLMGMKTDLRAFADVSVLGLAAAITVVAIVGKQVCGLVVVGKDIDRLSVGIGMVPRGEVGLIFANIGLTLNIAGVRVIEDRVYSAVVVMVILTTMMTPPLLRFSLRRSGKCDPGAKAVNPDVTPLLDEEAPSA